jgi:hypothetical protein
MLNSGFAKAEAQQEGDEERADRPHQAIAQLQEMFASSGCGLSSISSVTP